MECAACGRGNDIDARFCAGCGARLANVCPSCGHENAGDASFCNRCGTSLSAAHTPTDHSASEEGAEARRLATALFIDLVGFTPFTEQHDPEEVRAMLMRYFDVAKDVVARFGGEIDKFIGDAVLAFWGTTVAREDDAERAVRAALDLVDGVSRLGEELGIPDLRARAGVLTGETSVGSGGNTTGLVIGDIVNTASRLQSIAEPGTVYVGEATRHLSEAAIHYEDAGTHELKGKSEPMEVFRAVRVTGHRGGRGRHDGIEPPFVGRSVELRMLQDQLHETTRGRRSRLVSVIGEAGHGKSRLAQELKHYVDGLADNYLWHEGRSPAYGDGVSFWALGEMVRQRAGIAETDPPLVARTALRDLATRYAVDDEEATWLTRYLSGLLGIDEMPTGDRSEFFAALRTFLQRLAETAPVVLVFEDLHWGDDGMLDFVSDLVGRSDRHPILVVTLARPGLLERHPEWGRIGAGSSSRLAPLGEVDMRDLVTGTVDDLDATATDLIVANSAGIPLYAVEFLRTLVTEGALARVDGQLTQVAPIADLSTPDSLHAIIAARLDRFPSHLRRVIQDAAVLGQSFTREWLIETSENPEAGNALSDLVAAEVLRFEDDPRSPERGQYQFVQPTIREVAYGRLPKAERAQRHLAIAERFSAAGDPEFAAVVADHYLRAIEAGAGEGALDAAHHSLTAAAQRAADLHANAQVLEIAQKARDLPGSPGVELLVLGARAASNLGHHEEALSLIEAASDIAKGESERLLTARMRARLLIEGKGYAEALPAIEPYWDPDRLDEPAMAWLGASFANILMLHDQLPRAAEVAEAVLKAAEDLGDMELVIDSLNTLGTSRGIDHFHQGVALLAEAASLATRFGSLESQSRALNNKSVVGWLNGRMSIRDDTDRLLEIATRVGSLFSLQRAWFFRSQHLTDDGRFADALDALSNIPEVDEAALQRPLLLWALDGDPEHLSDLLSTADEMRERNIGNFQTVFLVDEFRTVAHHLLGDLRRSAEIAAATQADVLPPDAIIQFPLLGALESGNLDQLRSVRDRIGKRAGFRRLSFHSLADAIERFLNGDPAGPGAVLEAARLRAESDGPLAGHMVVATLGLVSDDPAVDEAVTTTERWFRESGGAGQLTRFERAWRSPASEAETA